MRLLMINLLATALVLFSAGFASAYELRLDETSTGSGAGGAYQVGDNLSYDIFLDTQGASDIVLISISLEFDQTVLGFDQAASLPEDYYPLYAYPVKGVAPATWLNPINNPFILWAGNAPPSGNDAVMVDFASQGFTPTQAVSANEYLGTIVFQVIGAGTSPQLWAFQNADMGDGDFGNIFELSGGNQITGAVSVVGGGPITVVPEPTTALLVGLGLVGLGAAGRRRA